MSSGGEPAEVSLEGVLELAQKVGLPVVLLGAGCVLVWKVLTVTLARLVETYNARVAAAEEDRDYHRARSTTTDELIVRLARELIDEVRAQRKDHV